MWPAHSYTPETFLGHHLDHDFLHVATSTGIVIHTDSTHRQSRISSTNTPFAFYKGYCSSVDPSIVNSFFVCPQDHAVAISNCDMLWSPPRVFHAILFLLPAIIIASNGCATIWVTLHHQVTPDSQMTSKSECFDQISLLQSTVYFVICS